VETKAQGQVSSPNVQKKLKAAVAWCERINLQPGEGWSNLTWHYVLLGESVFFEWRDKGALLSALCDFARIRSRVMPGMQTQLEAD
jgi:type III restriction enzyme